LVMIGDPKQAIYRFRGGDIDAYLAARAVADEHMTLTTNFRSAPAYVAALNELYAASGRVLSADPAHAIRCEEVSADPARRELCTVDGAACLQPLQIHLLEAPPDGQDERIEAALGACANHIVALLDGGHAIGGVPLQPRNIAVLAHARRHLVRLRELLHQRRVPCVVPGGASVFASEWARELQVLLYAALHPGDVRALRAALATRLGGHDWQRLRALGGDDPAAQQAGRWVHELGELWRRRGVLALVQAVIEHAGAALRAGTDHERALTDLRHLGELLQEHSAQVTGGDELLAWLARQREVGDARRDGDERELRIESDAARVSLLTLHARKGLEFDIVLLPIMWKAQPAAGEVVTIHDAASGQRVLGFDAAARARDDCEVQDERHRLLYVALTRARHACHVYALPPSRPARRNGRSAATDPQRAPLDAMLERLLAADAPARLKHVALSTAGWPWPPAQWSDAVAAPSARSARNEPPAVPLAYRYSFSALARRAARTLADEDAAGDEREVAAVELAAVDAAPAAQPCAALEPLLGVVGTAFGNAVHAVFESRRIGVPLSAQHELVACALRDARVRVDGAHGGVAATALVARLAERLQGVLDAPLPVGRHSQPSLGGLAAQAQRAEMEFNFVLDGVSLRALREVCPWTPGESFGDLRGLMNGKIDLVFEHEGRCHVVDYKTNRLGDGRDLAAYLPARLDAPMDEHHYRFQALLYTVAVERYLRQRVRDYRRGQHLGATLYLFVRAVGIEPSQPQAGIWTQRFDDALLDAVDRVLAGTATARSAP
ncbi:MAG: PD-(D/E)XK nuclease family protein, partial [Dokdonella sp.]|nr:PD-(D/E)XK nuclease family protein [Dokdonella sp.]